MALRPISLDQEQLPLERFLAEGTAERPSIFALDGAGTLFACILCRCRTIGPELETGHDSEGEDGASKVGVLMMDYNSVEQLIRESMTLCP